MRRAACLAESNAILWYLAEGTRFIPAEALQRAQVLQWMFFEQYSHEPYVATPRFIRKHLPAHSSRRAELPMRLEQGRAALALLDAHLESRRYLVAERYTIADIALYAYTHVADEAGLDLTALCAPARVAGPHRGAARARAPLPPPLLTHQRLRSSRSARNTARASGAPPSSGKLARTRATTCGSCRRKKTLMCFSSASVVTGAFGRFLRARARQQRRRCCVVGLAIEREFEIAREVLVPGIDAGRIRQVRELACEGFVEQLGLAAVVAVADTRIEERVAREQRGLLRIRKRADMRACVARGIQATQLHGAPDANDVARGQAPVYCRRCARRHWRAPAAALR